MLAKQYIPLNFVFKTIPVIIYPAKDDGDLTKAFSKKDSASIEKYVFDTLSIFDDKIQ